MGFMKPVPSGRKTPTGKPIYKAPTIAESRAVSSGGAGSEAYKEQYKGGGGTSSQVAQSKTITTAEADRATASLKQVEIAKTQEVQRQSKTITAEQLETATRGLRTVDVPAPQPQPQPRIQPQPQYISPIHKTMEGIEGARRIPTTEFERTQEATRSEQASRIKPKMVFPLSLMEDISGRRGMAQVPTMQPARVVMPAKPPPISEFEGIVGKDVFELQERPTLKTKAQALITKPIPSKYVGKAREVYGGVVDAIVGKYKDTAKRVKESSTGVYFMYGRGKLSRMFGKVAGEFEEAYDIQKGIPVPKIFEKSKFVSKSYKRFRDINLMITGGSGVVARKWEKKPFTPVVTVAGAYGFGFGFAGFGHATKFVLGAKTGKAVVTTVGVILGLTYGKGKIVEYVKAPTLAEKGGVVVGTGVELGLSVVGALSGTAAEAKMVKRFKAKHLRIQMELATIRETTGFVGGKYITKAGLEKPTKVTTYYDIFGRKLGKKEYIADIEGALRGVEGAAAFEGKYKTEFRLYEGVTKFKKKGKPIHGYFEEYGEGAVSVIQGVVGKKGKTPYEVAGLKMFKIETKAPGSKVVKPAYQIDSLLDIKRLAELGEKPVIYGDTKWKIKYFGRLKTKATMGGYEAGDILRVEHIKEIHGKPKVKYTGKIGDIKTEIDFPSKKVLWFNEIAKGGEIVSTDVVKPSAAKLRLEVLGGEIKVKPGQYFGVDLMIFPEQTIKVPPSPVPKIKPLPSISEALKMTALGIRIVTPPSKVIPLISLGEVFKEEVKPSLWVAPSKIIVTKPVVKPIIKLITEVKPIVRPITEVKPIVRPITEVKPIVRPITEVKPIVRPIVEPIVKVVQKPVFKTITKIITKPVTKSVVTPIVVVHPLPPPPPPPFFDIDFPTRKKPRARRLKPRKKKPFKHTYTPTLWGLELPRISATKAMGKQVFTGFEVRPRVKMPMVKL